MILRDNRSCFHNSPNSTTPSVILVTCLPNKELLPSETNR